MNKKQIRAIRENWAIYLLRGMKTKVQHWIRPHLPVTVYHVLVNAIDDSITLIKDRQQSRKEN
jgi:hypothetical protein